MGSFNEFLDVRRSTMIGMISILIFATLNLTAIFIDGDWRPSMMICELGRSDVTFVSILFTINCAISGIGMILCGYGILKEEVRQMVCISYIMIMCIGTFLIFVGLFDMNTDVHAGYAFAVAFILGTSLVTMIADDILQHRYVLVACIVVILLILGAVLLTAPQYSQSMSLFSMLAWWFVRLVLTNRTEDVLVRNSRILP